MIRDGYASVRYEYAGSSKTAAKQTWFDASGSPVKANGYYASIEKEYDGAGRVTLESY